jgi:uncharacterized oxidoreductase
LPEVCLFEPGPLEAFSRDVLIAMGAAPEVAREVAAHLIKANLSGHDSHGAMRLMQYVDQSDSGDIVPSAHPEVIHESGAVFVVDAHRGLGHYATSFATDHAVEIARRHGVAAGVVRHATHIGRLGHYTERAAEQGCVSIVTVGVAGPGIGMVVPFGGVERFLGTNPWSFGVPADGRPPLIFDAATSAVAEGKVRVARSKGAQVPAGAIVDAAGKPTTDPEKLYDGGGLLPVGGWAGHKGYGLSFASALIGGLAMIEDSEPTMAGASGLPPAPGRTAGVFLVVVDPGHFGDAGAYRAMVTVTMNAVKDVRPQDGVERVLVPGEPEVMIRERRAREGVAIPEKTREELAEIGDRFGVELPPCRRS